LPREQVVRRETENTKQKFSKKLRNDRFAHKEKDKEKNLRNEEHHLS